MLLISFIEGEFFLYYVKAKNLTSCLNLKNLDFHLKTANSFGVIPNKMTKSHFSLHTQNHNPTP